MRNYLAALRDVTVWVSLVCLLAQFVVMTDAGYKRQYTHGYPIGHFALAVVLWLLFALAHSVVFLADNYLEETL